MSYPQTLPEQVEFLKEHIEYFLGFNEYTEPEPSEDGIVVKIAQETPVHRVWKAIYTNFKKVNVDPNYIFPVKYMEKHRVVGGCSEFAYLTAAILRKKGYPAAIIDFLKADSIFDSPNKDRPIMEEHSAVLVYIDGKWYLYDSTDGTFTRFLVSKMIKRGYLVGNIYRDPIEVGITNRKIKFVKLMHNLKHILLWELQEDILVQDFVEKYKRYVESNKNTKIP